MHEGFSVSGAPFLGFGLADPAPKHWGGGRPQFAELVNGETATGLPFGFFQLFLSSRFLFCSWRCASPVLHFWQFWAGLLPVSRLTCVPGFGAIF